MIGCEINTSTNKSIDFEITLFDGEKLSGNIFIV